MANKLVFALVLLGLVGAFTSAYVYAVPSKPLPPAFTPASNPFSQGIYANGIVESDQSNGANTNIYPEVAGTIVRVDVAEGQEVKAGAPLFAIDDGVQRATMEQLKAQADASLAVLEELRAQPRKESLEVASAEVELAAASLKSAKDSFEKQKASYDIAPQSVSREALDTASNAARVAEANLDLARRRFDLTKAGAWAYDLKNQERVHEAQSKAAAAAGALLAKYVVKAPTDGVILSVGASVGGYVSPQGAYNTYTQGVGPVVVMSTSSEHLNVRCYVDEILIPRLPSPEKLKAEMTVRGTSTKVPLDFVRVQPYVSPKVQLSSQRLEKVDLRVLPVIFRFTQPSGVRVYPGQLVDVYVGRSKRARSSPSVPSAARRGVRGRS